MAKYSVLLVGRNKVLIGEFFNHLGNDLECLSCSRRFVDIRNHLKHFTPDALVYCLLEDSFDEMQQVISAKNRLEEEHVPLVIIGQQEDCDEFGRYSANAADMVMIKGSLTITQMCARLMKYLDDRQHSAGNGISSQSDDQKLLEAMRMLDLDITKPAGKKHILVVDDNPMMLKVIKESLREDYEVATAISGKIARKYLMNKSVDLILLDYEMPDENGSEILQKLRQDESTKDIPVIFLTGVKDKSKIQKVLQLKPQGYLLKPIEHDKLIAAIKNQLA